jgi:hypothetical protein
MSGHQNGGQDHDIKTVNPYRRSAAILDICEKQQEIKIPFIKKSRID